MDKVITRSDIQMSTWFMKKLITTRIYVVYEQDVVDGDIIKEYEPKYLTQEERDAQDYEIECKKQDESKRITEKTIKYNSTMWKLALLFFKLIDKNHVSVSLPLCEITKLGDVNNTRIVLECMQRMGLIMFNEDYHTGKLNVTIKNYSRTDFNSESMPRKLNPFEYLPVYFTSDEFMKLHFGEQKTMIYILHHKFACKNVGFKIFNREKLMQDIGERNVSRMDKYIEKAIEVLGVECDRDKKTVYQKKRQRVSVTFKISIGTFLGAGEPTYEKEIKDINEIEDEIIEASGAEKLEEKEYIKKDFKVKYIKDTLEATCDYSYIKEEENYLWLDLWNEFGQRGFVLACSKYDKGGIIESMPAYFRGILKDKEESTKAM